MRDLTIIIVTICMAGLANAVVTGRGTYAMMKIINAAPAEPYACDPTTEAHAVYVDDTDDNLWGMVCVCCNNDDGTGYAWVAGDQSGTPCIFVGE